MSVNRPSVPWERLRRPWRRNGAATAGRCVRAADDCSLTHTWQSRTREHKGTAARGVEAACRHAERHRQAVFDPDQELHPLQETPDRDADDRSDPGPRIPAEKVATRRPGLVRPKNPLEPGEPLCSD